MLATESLHLLQWATSHNSYDTDQQLVRAGRPFEPASLYDCGFRGIELDVVQDAKGGEEWCVRHGNSFDSAYKLLSSYLMELHDWSAAWPANAPHDPLFIHLDCKDIDVDATFPERLDAYLRRYLSDQPTYQPVDMLTPEGDLMQSAMSAGWPSPAELAGKFIFVLTGERAPKERYARRAPASRMCFADMDLHFGFNTKSGRRILANSDAGLMQESLTFGHWCADKRAVLWRVYCAEDEGAFHTLAALGPNMIAAERSVPIPGGGFWPNPLATTAVVG
jgi:hypothetical protein